LDDAEMNSYFNYYPRANWTIDGNEYQNNDLAEFGVARDTYVGDANYNTSVYFPAAITVGAHAYAKAGEFISNHAKLKWTVNINPQYAEPGMVVYDLIVHGDTHLQGKLENVTVKDAQGQTVNDEFINEAIAK